VIKIKFLNGWLKKIEDYFARKYKNKLKKLRKQLKEAAKKYKELEPSIRRYHKQAEEVKLAQEINNKYKKASVKYKARNGNYYDARSFIQFPSVVMQSMKKEIGINTGDSCDTIAYKVLMWAQKNLTYKTDTGEYWSFATDMLYKKHGDCEDGTFLIVSLMENLGVPAFRTKAVCGFVYNGDGTYGHSYPIYLRETDNEWVVLDWCFYENKDKIKDKILAKDNEKYGEIWFTFNSEFSWAQKNMEIDYRRSRDGAANKI
jgi:hypothetical protein